MDTENLLETFKLNEGIDLEEPIGRYRGLWGNSFRINVDGFAINTFEQRVKLIDKATEIEHQRLMNDENSWAITGLRKIGENWEAFDFDYGKEMLFNAIRYDLAYSRSERLPMDIAQKFFKLIVSDYNKDNAFIYCNYEHSPWDNIPLDNKPSHNSGWNLTDDWTLDLAIIILDSNKLTFSYFLSTD